MPPTFISLAGVTFFCSKPGRATEDKARAVLAKALGKPVHQVVLLVLNLWIKQLTQNTFVQVGLVIHPDQPWLSCSPDGILRCDDGYRLVEVRCPYSLRESKLIDWHKETSFVRYVKYVDGHFILKKSHSYYTHVMVMMHFFDVI